MSRPPTRLFHIHYHLPDVEHGERILSELGVPLHRRFGWVDEQPVSLRPHEEIPPGFRFHLQDSQRGYANVTLAPGNQVQFDHLGIVTTDFETVIERAREAGWNVRGENQQRTFLTTPWRFRIELHPDGDAVEAELGSWDEARFGEVSLLVPNARAEAVRAELDSVVGEIPGLIIREGDGKRPTVPRMTLVGSAFPDGATIEAEALQ